MSDIEDIRAMGGLGKAAGIASGISAGVESFFNVRSQLQEQALKKKLANAQSIEAYSKIIPYLGTDAAGPLAEKMGLIPHMDATAGAAQAQPPADGSQAPSNPGGQAPPSAHLDANPQQPTAAANSVQLTPAQRYQKAIADSYRKPQGEREGLMAVAKTEWEHEQPDYKAGLNAKAWEPLKDPMARMNTVGEQYTRGVRALKEGGPKSAPIIEDALAQMTVQSGGKPIPIAEQFAEEPRLLAKYNDWVSQKKKGQMDPELAEAFKKKFDLVGGAARDAYLSAGKDAEKRASGWSQEKPGWSRVGAVDAMNAQMGPLHKGKAAEGLVPGGLMGGDNANAKAKAPALPPGGLSRDQFKSWVLKHAP